MVKKEINVVVRVYVVYIIVFVFFLESSFLVYWDRIKFFVLLLVEFFILWKVGGGSGFCGVRSY